jgi:hypothetical protein
MHLEPVNEGHQALKDALTDAARSVSDKYKLTAVEILVIFCQMVGNLIAFQDQTKYTADEVMAMVGHNIQAGNDAVIQNLADIAKSNNTSH